MEKIYNPQLIERSLYDLWEKNGYFKPNNNLEKESFCIMMPPPNITGSLHMGHAFQQTLMDILIRYNRMQGKNTLWQVGTDHAGIATQILVERKIKLEEKKSKKDYNRDDFIKKIWLWKSESSTLITQQMRRLGNSVDWDLEKFTLDPDISLAVKEAFIILYNNQFIYQKKRLVHWDSNLETVVSDLEVEHKTIKGKKWFISYSIIYKNSLVDNNIKNLVVATTRPETLFGDTAIAINPNDHHHNHLIGQYVIVPLINRIIPIISDKHAILDKGTGCVKITPAHDFHDYQVGYRHKLPMINIFTFDGKIKKQSDIYDYQGIKSNIYDSFIPLDFQDLDILSARDKVIEEIKKIGCLVKIEESDIVIPYSDRSGVIIIPMLTNQWYLKTSELSKNAINAVKNKEIQFIPKQYTRMYFSWMNNIEDWCISRQLWWGHRIPIWYDNKKNIYVGRNEKEIRKKNKLSNEIILTQEKDVLDTWFSSALWTFSSLGWPKKNKLLKTFHSTNVLISGFDIIFFWISRMIMLTMYFMKDAQGKPQVPFKTVYITGLIRDEKGQKMSKSKGNVIDPIDMIDGISLSELIAKRTKNLIQPNIINMIRKDTIKKFPTGIESTGTDALRFTFAALASNTRDIHWDMNRLKGYRNFCNKLWNASRFVLMHTKNHDFCNICIKKNILLFNRWVLVEFNNTVKLYRESIDTYRFDIAANTLYDFIWNTFCDWYLEFSKIIIQNGTSLEINTTKNMLVYILESLLRLAHPIIPFITETIWQNIKIIKKIKNNTIMLQSFPQYEPKLLDLKVLYSVCWIKKIIIFLRNIRNTMNISSSKLLPLLVYNISYEKKIIIEENMLFLKKIVYIKSIDILDKKHNDPLSIKKIIDGVELIVPILQVIDINLELKRLKKEISKIEIYMQKSQKKIINEKFLQNAPKSIIEKEKENFIRLKKIYQKLSCHIKKFIYASQKHRK
ncbi:Valine--tRNA ligase [Buchnera aphidicola (Cavariella theobaldi)]|uniref:valine--tRNA ligase n=1 Tax=Buchnera aphidicola TaxID=9 RepID=UPI003A6A6F33